MGAEFKNLTKKTMDYNIEDGKYFKIVNSETGELIINGVGENGLVVSTNHDVIFFDSREDYLAEFPEPEAEEESGLEEEA